MKAVSIIIAMTIAFVGAVLLYNHYAQPSPLGDDFKLVDSNGKAVTIADIREKPAAIFFGYTMCPDICPTTLLSMQKWLAMLGDDADKIGVWFFTVDPERDTVEVLHDYISNFSDKIIGITGDPTEIKKTIKSFNVVAEKVMGEDGDYTYDHSAAVILLKKGGRLAGAIPYESNNDNVEQRDQEAVDRLKRLANSIKD